MRKLKALLAILSLLGIIIGCTEATTTEVITNDKKPEYKISFNANGGKGTMSDISIVAETSIILPENTFTRDNYTFMGWATTANGEVMFKNGAIFEGLYSNVTLYAKWEKKVVPVVKITITFDVNEAGGTAPTAIETTLNKNVDLPVLTNAKFSHWNTKADGSGHSYKTTATFTESVILYAILLAENAHTITYELDGGVNHSKNPYSFTEDDAVILREPTRDGYKFVGWYESPDFSGEKIELWYEGDKTANVTLYAMWEKEVVPVVKITITFDVNGAGGTVPTAIETTPDENVELPALTNAKFSHWNTSPDGSGQSYNGTATFTESVTLYAILLAENAHTITYELNGGVNHPKNKYSFTEDDVVILREPTKDGYIFVGWYETANFSGEKIELWYEGDKTANVTLYAMWKMVYTITFDANGGNGEMNKQEFIAGEEQKLNENTFTCDGNILDKWNTKPDGSGINYINGESYSFSENVTLYAQWITKLPPLEAGYFRINFTGTTTPMYIWIWGDFDYSEISKCTAWGDKAFPLTGKNGDFFAFDIKLVDNPAQVNFIILADGWKKLFGDADITFKFPAKYKEIWVDTTGKIWVDAAQTKEPAGLVSASITGGNEITMVTTGIDSVAATDFEVTDKNGNPINVTNATTTKLTIDNTDYINKAPYAVIYTDTNKNKDTVVANITSELLDEEIAYDGNDLGWHNGVAKVWAPLATKAEILIYDDMETAKDDYESNPAAASVTPVAMTNEGKGVWSANVPEGKYYMYQLENDGNTYRVCDIYANAASPDSVAAKAVDIAKKAWSETTYINPWGKNGTVSKKYPEAVIYEMHIRDWSRAFVKDSTGKFDDITNALKNNGAFAQHLKDLGVTHVQILPMFDYAQTNDDDGYNWGYNPYQYNVPEGRYVNDHDNDAEAAVDQMRNMIAAFHEAGIAVNMDVVYNHTNGTGVGSLFDMTVPKYYYRLTADGDYSSGSGCGNEMASNAAMYKKFMIDSLKHWMTDYHINGFRFDLMGLHETSTMRSVYDELKKIDPNVMVYGEPWTGGTSLVVSGVDKAKIDSCSSSSTENGVACFNDDYRNAIKGAEFGVFQKGQVQGNFGGDAICCGLMGSVKTVGTALSFTKVIGRSLNYVECHDYYTLADKLAISLNGGTSQRDWKAYSTFNDKQKNELRAQNKLAAAFVFLAQGTPFINGGQEFMRTKQGDENSYISDDSINAIDLTYKDTFNDVYKVYKGLIALRKSSNAFTAGTEVLADTVVNADGKKIGGFTKYVTTGTDDSYCVYFNATTENQAIDTTGYTKVVDVTSGAVTESTTLPATVAAKSFVILKK